MQNEKRKILEQKNAHLWFYGSPLVLCATHLELDIENGKLFADAKFINVQPEHIKEITVDVICYDFIRNIIDTIPNYTYTGFDISRNQEFGLTKKVPIKNMDTRNIEFVLKSVTTINDETWYNTENSKFNIDIEQRDIFSVLKDLTKQFNEVCANSNIDSSLLTLEPVFDEYHWMCGCGTLNWNDENVCSKCKISKQWLYENISGDALKNKERLRKIAEEHERIETEKRLKYEKERQQEEFKQRQQQYQKQVKAKKSKKIGKRISIIIIILLIIAAAVYGVLNYGIPYIAYSQAKESLEQQIFDSAITQFEQLGNFLDSEELLQKAKYEKAEYLYSIGQKAESVEIYREISLYKDSEQRYLEVEYEIADEYYANKDYQNAAEAYSKIPDYMDSSKKLDAAVENLYNSAVQMMTKHNANKAYDIFLYLGDYKDSETKLKECIRIKAEQMYEKMQYKDALDTYNQIDDYDSVPKTLEKLKNLSDIISAATDSSTPAAWICSDIKCNICNNPTSGVYTFAFGINGDYTLELSCKNHDSGKLRKTGHYKIENNKIYNLEYEKGKVVWKEMMTVISLEKLANETDGKNASLKVTDPFNTKRQITLYGNIISSDNIQF